MQIDNTFYMQTFLILSEIGYIINDFKSNEICSNDEEKKMAGNDEENLLNKIEGRVMITLGGKDTHDNNVNDKIIFSSNKEILGKLSKEMCKQINLLTYLNLFA